MWQNGNTNSMFVLRMVCLCLLCMWCRLCLSCVWCILCLYYVWCVHVCLMCGVFIYIFSLTKKKNVEKYQYFKIFWISNWKLIENKFRSKKKMKQIVEKFENTKIFKILFFFSHKNRKILFFPKNFKISKHMKFSKNKNPEISKT